jgi:2'-5' RNA ligase
MAVREPKSIVAYWLIPEESARTYLSSVIADLAARFDAPVFEPHLTLFAIAKQDDPIVPTEMDVLASFSPPRLSVCEVKSSDVFTKTIFVQFAACERLLQMNRALSEAWGRASNYDLDPHLSLIYKTMSDDQKRRIADSIKIPFRNVIFDSVKTVICPASIETREDVEAWRVADVRHLKDDHQ